MIMKPSRSINGTSPVSMINDRRVVLDALDATMKAMAETKPHGRDYMGRNAAYEIDRGIYADRFNVLDKLRNEIMEEALAIQGEN